TPTGHGGRDVQPTYTHPATPTASQMLPYPFVSGQKLVAAISAQHNFYVLGRFLSEIPGWNAAWVGEWFIQVSDDAAEIAGDILADRNGKVVQVQSVGDFPGLGAFIHLRAGKGRSERMQIAVAEPREPAGDHRRIDAAAQEQTEGPIGHRAHLHCLIERFEPVARERSRMPVTHFLKKAGIQIESQIVTVLKPVDRREHRSRRGDIAMGEI